jgi:hypothetical protein
MRACAADFVAYELKDKIAIDMPVTVTSPFTTGTVQLPRTPRKEPHAMRTLIGAAIMIALAGAPLAVAQQCLPGHDNPPCCGVPCVGTTLFVLETTGQNKNPHFVFSDDTPLFTVKGLTQTILPMGTKFNVSGFIDGTPQLVFAFEMTPEKAVKFLVGTDNQLTALGECVGLKTKLFVGFPTTTVIDGRTLSVGKPAFFCHDSTHGDQMCFGVKGDVTEPPPFPVVTPEVDRIEQVCAPATVTPIP